MCRWRWRQGLGRIGKVRINVSMIQGWDLKQTRDLVQTRFGRQQVELVSPCLNSIAERREYARYHYAETRHLLETYTSRFAGSHPLAAIFPSSIEEEQELQAFLVKTGAHALSCAQSMHSIADILGHAVYYSLYYNNRHFEDIRSERDISVKKVCKLASTIPNHVKISCLLKAFLDDPEFKYLDALISHSKHRSIVRTGLWIDLATEESIPAQLQFQSFIRNNKPYPARLISSFLDTEFTRISNFLAVIGNEINVLVKSAL